MPRELCSFDLTHYLDIEFSIQVSSSQISSSPVANDV